MGQTRRFLGREGNVKIEVNTTSEGTDRSVRSTRSELRLHVGAEDGVDAGLVAGMLAEPAEQVGVEADGYDFFGNRHDHLGVFPEGFVGGVGVGVGENSAAYFGWGHTAQPLPVRGGRALVKGPVRLRCFASSGVSRAVRSATPR
jgi:hypothetical protein